MGGDFGTGPSLVLVRPGQIRNPDAHRRPRSPACDVSQAQAVPSDEPGTLRCSQPIAIRPRFLSVRSYVFSGGCVTYAFDARADRATRLTFDAASALSFFPRSALVAHVAREDHLLLCGAGARCAS